MRILLVILLFLFSFQLTAQVYTEDFSGQNGFGIRGACVEDPSTCDTVNIPSPTGWTITGDASGMLNADDFFAVVDEQLQARDTDGEVCFLSPVFDITSCDTAMMTVLVEEVGDLETADYVDVYLTADTTTLLVVDYLGSGDSTHTLTGDIPDDGDWQSVVVELGDIVGDSGLLRICLSNNSGTESIRLDDIQVSCQPAAIPPEVFISEVDCDQEGTDTSEFIELGGPPGAILDYMVLVLYNGSDDASYAAYDLHGEQLDDQGLLTICFGENTAGYCDLLVSGQLQNGADGIGLYYGRAIEAFPNNTPVTAEGLIDGLRYSTGEMPDSGLAVLDVDQDCPENCQIDEQPASYSIQRGSWFVGPPTPGAVNVDPLPVEWLNFNASYLDGSAHLSWSTASEFHNAYFAVEYARDRSAFGEVGRVDGQHSSNSVRAYRFVHELPPVGDYHYYRIRAVDENGNADYTGIRVVESPQLPDVDIYPTFARSTFRVRWPEEVEGEVTVFRLDGRPVLRQSAGAGGVSDMDVSHLTPGIYVVHVAFGLETSVHKIVVGK